MARNNEPLSTRPPGKKTGSYAPSLWVNVIAYFNARLHQEVTRNDYLMNAFPDVSFGVLDCYRCYLMQAGYLETVKRGVYRVAKEIPASAPIKQIYEEAYAEQRA